MRGALAVFCLLNFSQVQAAPQSFETQAGPSILEGLRKISSYSSLKSWNYFHSMNVPVKIAFDKNPANLGPVLYYKTSYSPLKGEKEPPLDHILLRLDAARLERLSKDAGSMESFQSKTGEEKINRATLFMIPNAAAFLEMARLKHEGTWDNSAQTLLSYENAAVREMISEGLISSKENFTAEEGAYFKERGGLKQMLSSGTLNKQKQEEALFLCANATAAEAGCAAREGRFADAASALNFLSTQFQDAQHPGLQERYKQMTAETVRLHFLPALSEKDTTRRKNALKGLITLRNSRENVSGAISQVMRDEKRETEERTYAIQLYRDIEKEKSLPQLMEILKKDSNPSVRAHTAVIIGGMELKAKDIAVLVEALADVGEDTCHINREKQAAVGNVEERDLMAQVGDRAAAALGEIGPAATDFLMEALKNLNEKGRSRAARALGLYDHSDTAPIITALDNAIRSNRKSQAIVKESLLSLKQMGKPAGKHFIAYARDPKLTNNEFLHASILEGLGLTAGTEGLSELAYAIEEAKYIPRISAIHAVAKLMPLSLEEYKKVAPALIINLQYRQEGLDFPLQKEAATALSRQGEFALQDAVAALRGKNTETQRGAILVLKYMGPKAKNAAPALSAYLKKATGDLAKEASETLKVIE